MRPDRSNGDEVDLTKEFPFPSNEETAGSSSELITPRQRAQNSASALRSARPSARLCVVAKTMTSTVLIADKKSQMETARAIRGDAFTREMEERDQRKKNPAEVWINKSPPACCPKLVFAALRKTNAEALVQSTPETEVASVMTPTTLPVNPNLRAHEQKSGIYLVMK